MKGKRRNDSKPLSGTAIVSPGGSITPKTAVVIDKLRPG